MAVIGEILTQGKAPLATIRGAVVATIPAEISPAILVQFRDDLTSLISKSQSAAVIIDLSSLAYLDSSEFERLSGTIRIAQLMGSMVVVSGIQPAIASALTEFDLDLGATPTALNLEHAFELLDQSRAAFSAKATPENELLDDIADAAAQDNEIELD